MKFVFFVFLTFYSFLALSQELNSTDKNCFIVTGNTISDYTCDLKDIVIPGEINGVSITTIGFHAFSGHHLSSIVLPNSLVSIGSGAFSDNDIITVLIPDAVAEIGVAAFARNRIKSVSIPSSVQKISWYAFTYNPLTEVALSEGLKEIGQGAFADTLLTEVEIPSSVTEIGREAFQNSHLNSLIIKEGLKEIGEYVFSGNSLMEVTIPSSVTKIGFRAFFSNDLVSVSIPNPETKIHIFSFDDTVKILQQGNDYSALTIEKVLKANSGVRDGYDSIQRNFCNLSVMLPEIGDSDLWTMLVSWNSSPHSSYSSYRTSDGRWVLDLRKSKIVFHNFEANSFVEFYFEPQSLKFKKIVHQEKSNKWLCEIKN